MRKIYTHCGGNYTWAYFLHPRAKVSEIELFQLAVEFDAKRLSILELFPEYAESVEGMELNGWDVLEVSVPAFGFELWQVRLKDYNVYLTPLFGVCVNCTPQCQFDHTVISTKVHTTVYT